MNDREREIQDAKVERERRTGEVGNSLIERNPRLRAQFAKLAEQAKALDTHPLTPQARQAIIHGSKEPSNL